MNIAGYHIREAGADAVQELAFTLANAIAYIEAAAALGLAVDEFAPRLSYSLGCFRDLIEEIA
jgi:methylmalonyl-CoA mutase N-terminal domain/subunit